MSQRSHLRFNGQLIAKAPQVGHTAEVFPRPSLYPVRIAPQFRQCRLTNFQFRIHIRLPFFPDIPVPIFRCRKRRKYICRRSLPSVNTYSRPRRRGISRQSFFFRSFHIPFREMTTIYVVRARNRPPRVIYRSANWADGFARNDPEPHQQLGSAECTILFLFHFFQSSFSYKYEQMFVFSSIIAAEKTFVKRIYIENQGIKISQKLLSGIVDRSSVLFILAGEKNIRDLKFERMDDGVQYVVRDIA